MKCLTKDECRDWCKQHLITVDNSSNLSFAQTSALKLEFAVPQQSRMLACLSKQLLFALGTWKSTMIWITSWGIWSTEQDWCLFSKFRKGYGESRELSAAPGHIFSADEKEDITALLRLILIFGWDANVITVDHDLIMFLSHDEYADVAFKRESQLTDFKNSLGKINIDFLAKR